MICQHWNNERLLLELLCRRRSQGERFTGHTLVYRRRSGADCGRLPQNDLRASLYVNQRTVGWLVGSALSCPLGFDRL